MGEQNYDEPSPKDARNGWRNAAQPGAPLPGGGESEQGHDRIPMRLVSLRLAPRKGSIGFRAFMHKRRVKKA